MEFLCVILTILAVLFGILFVLMTCGDCGCCAIFALILCALCAWGSIAIENNNTVSITETIVVEITHMEYARTDTGHDRYLIVFAGDGYAGSTYVSVEEYANFEIGDKIETEVVKTYKYGEYRHTNYELI